MFNISKTGYDYGISTSIMDGISNVYGLIASTSGELVYDFNYCYGMVLNLEKESTRVIAFSYDSLMAGSYLFRTYLGVIIPVNFVLMGNVFTSLGDWINKSFTEVFTFPLNVIKYLGKMLKLIELKAPGIIMRGSVREPLLSVYNDIAVNINKYLYTRINSDVNYINIFKDINNEYIMLTEKKIWVAKKGGVIYNMLKGHIKIFKI